MGVSVARAQSNDDPLFRAWGATPGPIPDPQPEPPEPIPLPSPPIALRPYETLVCSYDWPCETALRIMECESTHNPLALKSGNYGLFQINSIHAGMVGGDPRRFYDPETNVRVAHDLWVARGWTPWVFCSR